VLYSANGIAVTTPEPHAFHIAPARGPTLDFTLSYAPGRIGKTADVAAVLAQSAAHWQAFWRSGAAIDFSGSTDARAAERNGAWCCRSI
jgi:hypothetical protein